MAGMLSVTVVSPDRTVYSGEASSVVAPAWDGKVGVLPGHAPMIALLGAGEMSLGTGVDKETFHIAGGLLKVEGDSVTVLAEYAAKDPAPPDLVKALMGRQIDLDAVDERTAAARPGNPLA